MDFGNVPALSWFYAALAPGLLIGAVLLMRHARTAPAGVGLGLIMLGNGIQGLAGVMVWASASATQATWFAWMEILFAAAVWLSGYVWLIGYVPAGWNNWMRSLWFKIGMSLMILASVVALAWSVLGQARFLAGNQGYPLTFDNAPPGTFESVPTFSVWLLSTAIVATSLAIAISAAHQAIPGVHRRSAFAYLAGIGIIDIFLLAGLLGEIWPVLYAGIPQAAWAWISFSLYGIWMPAWVAYAILTTRMFDLDLRIKWAINRGTIVAIFVAVFFGVTLFMQEFLTQRLGLLGGAAAAAALFLVLAPVRRLAARFASSLMPNTVATPAYTTHRKVEIYREALRDTLVGDNEITASERRLLDYLRDQLELDEASVVALEAEARGQGPS